MLPVIHNRWKTPRSSMGLSMGLGTDVHGLSRVDVGDESINFGT